jgi:hypothetical protein
MWLTSCVSVESSKAVLPVGSSDGTARRGAGKEATGLAVKNKGPIETKISLEELRALTEQYTGAAGKALAAWSLSGQQGCCWHRLQRRCGLLQPAAAELWLWL